MIIFATNTILMARKAKAPSHPFVKLDNNFRGKNATFPDRSIDPALKGSEYCRKWTEGIYSVFLNDRTSWGVSAFDHMNLMRLYAMGEQPVDTYQRILLDESEDDLGVGIQDIGDMPISRVAKREGWLNVLWKPLSIAPKIINNILGMMEGVDFDIFVDAIDSNSRDLEATAKAKARVVSLNKDFLLNFKQAAGLPTFEEEMMPDNPFELEFIESMDGFKVNYAKGMQQIIRHTMEMSKWDDVLFKKLITDLLTVRRCATRDYYDPEDRKFKTKYIDVARAGVQYSNDLDFSDAEYAYYCDLMTISELRLLIPGITEQELFSIAESSYGMFGNPVSLSNPRSLLASPDTLPSEYPWNNFYVSVFHAEWMDFDLHRAKKYTNRYGKERFIPIAYNEEIAPPTTRDQRRGITISEQITEIRQPYQCSWVVGTEHVFDYGKTHFAARPQPSKPRLSFHFEQLLMPSIIETIFPILDQFQITWYKYQNLRAQAIESGFAIDFGMLINLTDGEGKKYPLNEVLKMWKQTGVLAFMSSRFGNYQGGAVTPVTPIPNNYMQGIQGIQVDFNMQFQLLEQTTGINPVALGQSPNPEAPVSTTEAALQGTANVLKPISTATRELKENVAVSLMSMIQSGIKAEKAIEKAYELVVGPSILGYIKDAEKDGAQYGLTMKSKPDQLFKQNMAKNIQIALQSGRDGKAGVDLPEAMLLEEQLLRGEDITQLRQNLTFLIARHKKELERKEKENIMLQNQGLMQLEQVKAQNMQMETRSKAAIAQAAEVEKRKTERLVQNYQFLNKLMETVQKEEQTGVVSPQNANRLQLAMTVAGQLNLAEADLPSEVARIERSRPQLPAMGMPPVASPQQSSAPQFPPMGQPAEMPL